MAALDGYSSSTSCSPERARGTSSDSALARSPLDSCAGSRASGTRPIDELEDRRKAWFVTVGRVHFDRRGWNRDALEGLERSRPVLENLPTVLSPWAFRRSWLAAERWTARSQETAASTLQWTRRRSAASASGSSPILHSRSWKAASATTDTPSASSTRTTSKKSGKVRWVRGSPCPPWKSRPWAWTMPSLISSRQMAGQGIASAMACARVVLPDPGGPLTTTSVGVGPFTRET